MANPNQVSERRRRRGRLWAGCAQGGPFVVAMSIVAGCASSSEPMATAPPFIEPATQSASAPATAAATQPQQPSLTASVIFSLAPGEITFGSLDKEGQRDGAVVIRTSPTAEHGAQSAVADGERRIEFLKQLDDGSIALTAVIEKADNALTLFDPPLIIAPAVLRLGETFESAAPMRVVALDDPSNQREHGQARRTITYSDDVIVSLSSGKMPAAKLEIRFDADLRMADAVERTTLYVSREHGLIAQASTERITILGAFPRSARRTLLREMGDTP